MIPLLAPLLLKFPLLGRLPWRWIGIGAAVLAVGVVYVKHRNDLIEAGRAEVRALWDADKLLQAEAVAKAVADAKASEAAATERNEVIEREYQEKLAAAAADRDGIYRLLQSARGQVRASASREATSATIAAATREAAIAERVDRAVAGVVAESRANADQLDALIAVVKPQM